MNIKKAQRYKQLNFKLRALESQIDVVKKEMAILEEEITSEFEKEGLRSIKLKDATVYLNRSIFASVKAAPRSIEYEETLKKLKRTELKDIISTYVHPQSLSARLREMLDEDLPLSQAIEKLPKVIQENINLAEVFRIRVRKSD